MYEKIMYEKTTRDHAIARGFEKLLDSLKLHRSVKRRRGVHLSACRIHRFRGREFR